MTQDLLLVPSLIPPHRACRGESSGRDSSPQPQDRPLWDWRVHFGQFRPVSLEL